MKLHPLLGLTALASLALCLTLNLGCGGEDKGDTSIYVLGKNKIRAWDDMDALFTAAKENKEIPQPREIPFKKSIVHGGMAMDTSRGDLYLLSEAGILYKVSGARGVNGGSPEIKEITLELTETKKNDGKEEQVPIKDIKWGQIAYGYNDCLYIALGRTIGSEREKKEIGGVLKVDLLKFNKEGKIDKNKSFIGHRVGQEDQWVKGCCRGVACFSDALYGYFSSNEAKKNLDAETVKSNIFKGDQTAFNSASVAEKQTWGARGLMAADTTNKRLYVCHSAPKKKLSESYDGSIEVLDIVKSHEGNTLNAFSADLIAHAGNKPWLVGATYGDATLHIYKTPEKKENQEKSEAEHRSLDLEGNILGLALDGGR